MYLWLYLVHWTSELFDIGINIRCWALVQIYSRDVGVSCQSWGRHFIATPQKQPSLNMVCFPSSGIFIETRFNVLLEKYSRVVSVGSNMMVWKVSSRYMAKMYRSDSLRLKSWIMQTSEVTWYYKLTLRWPHGSCIAVGKYIWYTSKCITISIVNRRHR